MDFEGEGDALAAAGGLGGVATKRPRASVAVFTEGGALRGGVCGVAGAASGARVASASFKRLRARSSNGAGSTTKRHSTRSAQSLARRVLTADGARANGSQSVFERSPSSPSGRLHVPTGRGGSPRAGGASRTRHRNTALFRFTRSSNRSRAQVGYKES